MKKMQVYKAGSVEITIAGRRIGKGHVSWTGNHATLNAYECDRNGRVTLFVEMPRANAKQMARGMRALGLDAIAVPMRKEFARGPLFEVRSKHDHDSLVGKTVHALLPSDTPMSFDGQTVHMSKRRWRRALQQMRRIFGDAEKVAVLDTGLVLDMPDEAFNEMLRQMACP